MKVAHVFEACPIDGPLAGLAAGMAFRPATHARKAPAPTVSRSWRGLSAVLWSLAFLGLPATLASEAKAAPTPTPLAAYALRVLPTLQCPISFACQNATFDLSNAAGINDRGWIVGDANVPGSTNAANATEHATLWRGGQITDLGTLGGPNSGIGFLGRPNETGLISGSAQTGTPDPFGENWGVQDSCDANGDVCSGWQYELRGFVWTQGVARPLPTLGGDNALAFGGANDRGQIVGTAEKATPDGNCQTSWFYDSALNLNIRLHQQLDYEPVVWGPRYGEIHALPLPLGDSIGGAVAINDAGQVIGGSGPICEPLNFGAIQHALLWQNGLPPTNLGSLGGQYNNVPTAINDLGQVVGLSDLPGDTTTHAFLWHKGVMTDLGTLPGDANSLANAINDQGQVVGQSCDTSGNCRGFLWQHGVMTDLNAITDRPAGFDLDTAEGINDQGVIVGNVYDPALGTAFAFAAIPSGNASTANQSPTGSGQLTRGATAPKTILPASVRAQLRSQLRVGLLLGGAR